MSTNHQRPALCNGWKRNSSVAPFLVRHFDRSGPAFVRPWICLPVAATRIRRAALPPSTVPLRPFARRSVSRSGSRSTTASSNAFIASASPRATSAEPLNAMDSHNRARPLSVARSASGINPNMLASEMKTTTTLAMAREIRNRGDSHLMVTVPCGILSRPSRGQGSLVLNNVFERFFLALVPWAAVGYDHQRVEHGPCGQRGQDTRQQQSAAHDPQHISHSEPRDNGPTEPMATVLNCKSDSNVSWNSSRSRHKFGPFAGTSPNRRHRDKCCCYGLHYGFLELARFLDRFRTRRFVLVIPIGCPHEAATQSTAAVSWSAETSITPTSSTGGSGRALGSWRRRRRSWRWRFGRDGVALLVHRFGRILENGILWQRVSRSGVSLTGGSSTSTSVGSRTTKRVTEMVKLRVILDPSDDMAAYRDCVARRCSAERQRGRDDSAY